MAQPIEIKVNHRCGAQRKNLRQRQSTYNRDAKWPTQFSADTDADHLTEWGIMRLADAHPEPGFPILPVRSGIDP